MSSSCLTARGVSPSPHVFSRGKRFFSTSSTSWPASANQYAHAAPEGPAPTTSTSLSEPLTNTVSPIFPPATLAPAAPAAEGRQIRLARENDSAELDPASPVERSTVELARTE